MNKNQILYLQACLKVISVREELLAKEIEFEDAIQNRSTLSNNLDENDVLECDVWLDRWIEINE